MWFESREIRGVRRALGFLPIPVRFHKSKPWLNVRSAVFAKYKVRLGNGVALNSCMLEPLKLSIISAEEIVRTVKKIAKQ
jgi:hypothetical protein